MRIPTPVAGRAAARRSRLEPCLAMVFDWLLPGPCAACGDNVDELVPRLALCRNCQLAWPRRDPDSCTICGRPAAATAPDGYRCGTCRRRSRIPHLTLTVGWAYREPVASSLRALKFHRLERVARDLVEVLFENLTAAELARLGSVDSIVAVPLWRWRRLARGYNQAEVLARHIGGRLRLPYAPLLSRVSGARPQSRLARVERRANVRSSMRVRRRKSVPSSILLVDDVITTGATLEEAARTLRQSGADAIHLLALARTPDP